MMTSTSALGKSRVRYRTYLPDLTVSYLVFRAKIMQDYLWAEVSRIPRPFPRKAKRQVVRFRALRGSSTVLLRFLRLSIYLAREHL